MIVTTLGKRWTPHENALLIEQLSRGLRPAHCIVPGREKTSIEYRAYYLSVKDKRVQVAKQYGEFGPRKWSAKVSPAQQLEKDRLAAMPMTLSQFLFGDPLPGRSALDKRKARAEARHVW